jgi:hypothetical protein
LTRAKADLGLLIDTDVPLVPLAVKTADQDCDVPCVLVALACEEMR